MPISVFRASAFAGPTPFKNSIGVLRRSLSMYPKMMNSFDMVAFFTSLKWENSIFESMLKYLLLCIPLSLSAQQYEVDDAVPRELIVDQDSLHADLFFEPEDGIVEGTVHLYVHKMERTDSIWLDAKPSISVVNPPRFNGGEVTWSREEQGIVLRPSSEWEESEIEIDFSSRPFKGVYFNGWDDPSGKARRQIFTQGQGIDHRHWLPHVDAQNDKLMTSLSITFDSDFQVLANGELVSKASEGAEMTTWTYVMHHPHSSYLMAFVIGKYHETVVGESPFRAVYMYEDLDDAYPTTYYANDQVWTYLNDRIGYPFVWSAYRQAPVANFPHGAMENTCMTIFSEVFIADSASFADRNYVYVNAHELAHHWFGDLVTVPSSHDFWLHEGFATYYQMEAERAVFGHEHYTYEWMKALDLVRTANEVDAFPLQHSKAGSHRFYQLGALTLRALEHEVGTTVFDSAIVRYLEQNAFGLVTTSTFKNVMEETCECELDDFFAAYVEKPHESTGYVDYQIDESTKALVIRAKQWNKWGEPLPIHRLHVRIWKDEFEYEDRFINFEKDTWSELFRFEDRWTVVEFDPYHHYPIDWKIELPDSMAINMAMMCSPYTQARVVSQIDLESEYFRDLAGLMMDIGPQCTRDSLMSRAAKERPENFEEIMFMAMILSEDINSVGHFARLFPFSELDEKQVDGMILALRDTSSLSDANALKVAFSIIGSNRNSIPDVLEALDTRSGGLDHDIDLFCAYLTVAIKGRSDVAGLPRLLDFAGPSYSNDIRQSAWDYLSMLKYSGEDLREIQYAALTSRHRHLRNAAVKRAKEYLSTMNRNREIREIQFALKDAHPDDIARVERILDIQLDLD
ncbi:M1 family metallopeptidase [Phaeocystidibacter marisrubri]|uniref:Aminopeptidase N n=2 Tax=Phaeocystidibacter marisrubri TaxID=1577780 RepID=A0A6L3ZGS1_9FLAO|nr:M1 family metallopeptidase [Phaeocystidibacter marisrubri]